MAAFPTIMMMTKRKKFATWSVETDLARPLHVVFLQGDKSEAESNDECGETPAHCVIMAATAWQSVSGLDLVLFSPSGGVFCCSDITAKDPAWQRPSWRGVVHFFVLFQCWVTPRFFDEYKSVVCGWVLRFCFDFVAVLSGVVWPRLSTVRVELCCHIDAPIQLSEFVWFASKS